MDQKLLIDATYAEEVRVVALEDGKLQEFDVEPSTGLQTIRNIYLARIEKIEPALQAAFVNYGVDKHGFLPFRRIHPTYYKVLNSTGLTDPVAEVGNTDSSPAPEDEPQLGEIRNGDPYSLTLAGFNAYEQDFAALSLTSSPSRGGSVIESTNGTGKRRSRKRKYNRRYRERHQYRIQDVIRPGQVLIVQVKKDELDEKGASLTTYISLAGHYCVLLPNTDKGCILSSKISSENNRQRLQQIYNGLDLRRGAAMIMRTAGCNQKEETIQREYNSLVKMWNDIMRRARKAVAPAPLYVDGNLIDRSLRDVFRSSAGVIHVDGEDGYQRALAYLKREIPEAVDRVKLHSGQIPLFVKHKIDQEIRHLTRSEVPLNSGGHIVIQKTEALVSIDVNSGRATDKNTLRETALQTNIEAADEIARQLQLRDLAGLIVIDFIDMDEARHRNTVERRFRAAVKRTRGRSRVGFITNFGLLEMTRQRIGRDYFGSSTTICHKCHGTGRVLLDKQFAISVLRHIEAECSSRRTGKIEATVPVDVANSIHNELRHHLERIEDRFQSKLIVRGDAILNPPEYSFDLFGPISNKPIFGYSSIAGQSEDDELDMRGSRWPPQSATWRGRRRGRNGSHRTHAPLVFGSENHGALPIQSTGVGEQPDALNVLEIEGGGQRRHGDVTTRPANHSEGKKRNRRGKRGGRGRKRKAGAREDRKARVSSTELKAGIRNGDIETTDRRQSNAMKKQERVKGLQQSGLNSGKSDHIASAAAEAGARELSVVKADAGQSRSSQSGNAHTGEPRSLLPEDSGATDSKPSTASEANSKRSRQSKRTGKVAKEVIRDVAKADNVDKVEAPRDPVEEVVPQQVLTTAKKETAPLAKSRRSTKSKRTGKAAKVEGPLDPVEEAAPKQVLTTSEKETDSSDSSRQSPPAGNLLETAASSEAPDLPEARTRGAEQKDIRQPGADSSDTAASVEVSAKRLQVREPLLSGGAQSSKVKDTEPGSPQDSASPQLPDNDADAPRKPGSAGKVKGKKVDAAAGSVAPLQAKKADKRKTPNEKTRARATKRADPGKVDRKPDKLSRELDRMYPPELQIIPDELDCLAPLLTEVFND